MSGNDRNPDMRLSPFRLEKILSGQEPPRTGEDGRKLEDARVTGDEFLRRYPDWTSLDASRRESVRSGRGKILPFRLPSRPGGRFLLALAAALALALVPAGLFLTGRPAEDTRLTVKGGAYFSLLVGRRPVDPGRDIPARSGDTLQFFLHHPSSHSLHYAVFYRDDGGPWETYFTSTGKAPASPRGEPLRHSIVLDADWRSQEIATVAGALPPGAATRDCLPPPDAGLTGLKVNKAGAMDAAAPGFCRDLHVQLFRLLRVEEP